MLANMKEEVSSPTRNPPPSGVNNSTTTTNNTTTQSNTSIVGSLMTKEEPGQIQHQHSIGMNTNNTNSVPSNTNNNNGQVLTGNTMGVSNSSPNVIPPSYHQMTPSGANNNPLMEPVPQQQHAHHHHHHQHGFYSHPMHHHPPHHHQPPYYGYHHAPSHHHYPPVHSSIPPSIPPTTAVYGASEGYSPNVNQIQSTLPIQQPPYIKTENSVVQQPTPSQNATYQQQHSPVNNTQQPPVQQPTNGTAQSAISQSTTQQNSQQPVTHAIFHEYQTHKKSGGSSPIHDANSGEYHPIACIPCRKRHKKCDRLLPKCTECGKRGMDCQYYEPKQKGRKKKDENPNSSEFSPPPTSPTNNTQSEISQPQYSSTPQTPTNSSAYGGNYQQTGYGTAPAQPPQNGTPQENSPASFQTRERSASYQKYRSEPYPNVNRDHLSTTLYTNNGMNGSNVTPQRERAVSSTSSSNYYPVHYNGTNTQQSPMNLNNTSSPAINNGTPNNMKMMYPSSVSNQPQFLQTNRVLMSSSPDSSNETNIPPVTKFVSIEKERLKDQLIIRRAELEAWDTMRVSQWIDTLDSSFPPHSIGELFKHHDIDGLALLGLHNQILLDMGVTKVGVRLRLCRIIDHLRTQN